MDDTRERLDERRGREVDRVRDPVGVVREDRDALGEATRERGAEAARSFAQVPATGATPVARAAEHGRLHGDAVTDDDRFDSFAYLDDRARELVAGAAGERRHRELAGEDVQIRAADPGRGNLDDDPAGPGFGFRDILDLHLARLREDDCAHAA